MIRRILPRPDGPKRSGFGAGAILAMLTVVGGCATTPTREARDPNLRCVGGNAGEPMDIAGTEVCISMRTQFTARFGNGNGILPIHHGGSQQPVPPRPR